MKKTVIALVILSAFFTFPAFADKSGITNSETRKIILHSVKDLTHDSDFAYLKGTIYNVLRLNMEKQETLQLLDDHSKKEGETLIVQGFEQMLKTLSGRNPGASLILTEYYTMEEALHILVSVWDLDTMRIKNTFIESMPADLDLLANIEKMALHIAEAVAMELPPTNREAVFGQQIALGIRQKMNTEDRFIDEIFDKHHEFSLSPFTGIGTGRSVISWSKDGPFISPGLGASYTYLLNNNRHLSFSAEYLGLDLQDIKTGRYEMSFESRYGFHTKSRFSFSASAGLAATYTYNPESAALACSDGPLTVYPKAERVSLSIPVVLGFTLYHSPGFFSSFSLNYYGLNYTIEDMPSEQYDIGNARLKYNKGFSPWNLLCLSISMNTGLRM